MAHYVFLLLIPVVAIVILLGLLEMREERNERLQKERCDAYYQSYIIMPREKAKRLILQSTVDGDISCMMESGEYIPLYRVSPPEPLGERVGEMTAEEKACHTLVYTYGAKIGIEIAGLQKKNPDVDWGNSQKIKDLNSRRDEVKGRLCISLTQRFCPQYQKGEFPGVTVQEDFSVWTYASAEKRKAQ